MECVGAWLDNIMGAISLCPQLFQFCMSFCGGTGFLGCNLAACSQVINAIHCLACWELSFGKLIDPVVEKMKEQIEGVVNK